MLKKQSGVLRQFIDYAGQTCTTQSGKTWDFGVNVNMTGELFWDGIQLLGDKGNWSESYLFAVPNI